MKKRLENIIKNNSFFNIMYSFFGSLIIRTIGLFVKKEKGLVLFVSFMGTGFNDSPKEIYEAMITNPKFKKFRYVWAFGNPEKYEFSNNQTSTVKMDSFSYLLTALKAEYWITNVNIERGLHFKKKYTTYVNTWHGVPLKFVGNHVKGRSDFNFSTVDYFCASSTFDKDIYIKAFNVDENNLHMVGMPRNDLVIDNSDVIKNEVRASLGIDDRRIILYAPTWRDTSEDIATINVELWKEKISDKYVLLQKSHHLTSETSYQNDTFSLDVSHYEDTNKLIVAADILITDYSSIMFDYAILGKPIFILANDYESYKNSRGVYFELTLGIL